MFLRLSRFMRNLEGASTRRSSGVSTMGILRRGVDESEELGAVFSIPEFPTSSGRSFVRLVRSTTDNASKEFDSLVVSTRMKRYRRQIPFPKSSTRLSYPQRTKRYRRVVR